MAEGEKVEQRPKCGYKVEVKHADGGTSKAPCGSEEGLRMVKGKARTSGAPMATPVCAKHRLDAWRSWNVDAEEQIPPRPVTTLCCCEICLGLKRPT